MSKWMFEENLACSSNPLYSPSYDDLDNPLWDFDIMNESIMNNNCTGVVMESTEAYVKYVNGILYGVSTVSASQELFFFYKMND